MCVCLEPVVVLQSFKNDEEQEEEAGFCVVSCAMWKTSVENTVFCGNKIYTTLMTMSHQERQVNKGNEMAK